MMSIIMYTPLFVIPYMLPCFLKRTGNQDVNGVLIENGKNGVNRGWGLLIGQSRRHWWVPHAT